jgi:hypothetical protein
MMNRVVLSLVLFLAAAPLFAHCDWTKGPVVLDARAALEAGDLAPVLKWVTPADEKELRDAFARTLAVRAAGGEAKELADRWFFETTVRLHRSAEGAPYHGLRGDDYVPDPSIILAETALERGSLADVEKVLAAEVAAGLKAKFGEAMEAKEHASHNADAGRHYVHAYAGFLHYVLGLHQAAAAVPGGKHED